MEIKPYYQDNLITLYQGDCFDILSQIDKVDLVLTDPPYIQNFTNTSDFMQDRPMMQGIQDYGSHNQLDYTTLLSVLESKVNEKNMFFFCDKETKYNLITWVKEHKWGYKELCFCKTSPIPLVNGQWLHDTEFGLHFYKSLKVRGSYKTKRSWSVVRNMAEDNIDHPTPKRVKEVQRVLENISEKGQVVLDPFAGSGSTGVACRNLGLKCIMIEREEKFCKLIKNRLTPKGLFRLQGV